MNMIAKQSGKRKRAQVDFTGKACWVGVDVHKSSYAVAILDEDGQRQEFSTLAEPKRLLVQLLKMGMYIQALVYESGPCGYGLRRSGGRSRTESHSSPGVKKRQDGSPGQHESGGASGTGHVEEYHDSKP